MSNPSPLQCTRNSHLCKVEYLAGLTQPTPMRSVSHYEPISALVSGCPSTRRLHPNQDRVARLDPLPVSLLSPSHMILFTLRPLSCPRYAIAPLFLLGPQRDRRLLCPPSRATRHTRVDALTMRVDSLLIYSPPLPQFTLFRSTHSR